MICAQVTNQESDNFHHARAVPTRNAQPSNLDNRQRNPALERGQVMGGNRPVRDAQGYSRVRILRWLHKCLNSSKSRDCPHILDVRTGIRTHHSELTAHQHGSAKAKHRTSCFAEAKPDQDRRPDCINHLLTLCFPFEELTVEKRPRNASNGRFNDDGGDGSNRLAGSSVQYGNRNRSTPGAGT
jgi:hypothetical protein